MGLFDNAGLFKKDFEGKTVFFPWGSMGKGYVVPTVAEDERLRRVIKISNMVIMFAIAASYIIFLGSLVPLAIICPISFAWYVIWVHITTKGMSQSYEIFNVAEARRNVIQSYNLSTLVAAEVIFLVFLAGGVQIVMDGHQVAVGVFFVMLFGLGSAAAGYMIMQKIKR